MINKKDPFHTAAGTASSMKETKSGDGFRYGASIAPSAAIKKALSPKAVAVSSKVAVAPAMSKSVERRVASMSTMAKAPAVVSKVSVAAPKAAYKADKEKMAMVKKLPIKPMVKKVKMAPMKKIAIKVKK